MRMVGKDTVLLILDVAGHAANPMVAYKDLLAASPTTSPNQPLLTVNRKGKMTVITVDMLSRAPRVMLDALGME